MDDERRPPTRRSAPTRPTVLAWADAHSLDISNAEADDLVRRLWHPPTLFELEAVERCVTDALLLMAEGIGHDERTAESLRGLAARVSDTMVSLGLMRQARRVMPDGEREPDTPDGTAEQEDAENDGAPGDVVGAADGTPLRYDAIYIKPVAVMLHGKKATAYWPPSFGTVKLKPEGSRRSVVVPLDDLDIQSRALLRYLPTRRRTEVVVRCSMRNCRRCYRSWVRHDTRIEDLKGRPTNEFGALFAARCERHREPL